MLSSLNSYSGLSSADILMLFGANSASSSASSTSASSAQSASTGASSSDANDPAAAIKAILAQSQIAAGAGAANVETVAAAYAAQTAGSNVVIGAAAAISSGAATDVSNPGIMSGSSLLVATANGLESVTTGSGTQIATMLQGATLANYDNDLATAQQTLARDLIPASTTDASPTPASDGTSASGASPQAQQSVLLLRVAVVGGGFPASAAPPSLNTLIGALTQQLVSSFENNTLSSTSAPATGFSYSETYGNFDIVITGIEASVPESAPLTDTIRQSDGSAIPDFLTTVAAGDYDFFSDGASNVIIPLGNS